MSRFNVIVVLNIDLFPREPGGGGGRGYSLIWAILVINRVSILVDFGHNWVWFLYSSLDMGMF